MDLKSNDDLLFQNPTIDNTMICISAIKFYCHIKSIINPVMTKKLFFNDVVYNLLDNKNYLMQLISNLNQRKVFLNCNVKMSNYANNSSSHIASFVRRQIKQMDYSICSIKTLHNYNLEAKLCGGKIASKDQVKA